MPFLVFRWDAAGVNARLASEEMTSPTDLPSVVAISLAALKTSSSMTRVVRIGKISPSNRSARILHQMRDATRQKEFLLNPVQAACRPGTK
jgi:hypothetical protein